MTRVTQLNHEFVEHVPREMKDGVVYVSIPYHTVLHKCCCGCGQQVVTPLSPAQWTLIFDGETVSLHPSIGNWNFPCQSHYWIRQNMVIWAGQLSERQIAVVQRQDMAAIQHHFSEADEDHETTQGALPKPPPKRDGLLTRLKRRLLGK